VNQSDILQFLEAVGRRPNRALSQNFLVDENIALKIVRTADVSASDAVLEIGPGPGSLTVLLLEAGARVFAVEKDQVFAKELSRFQTTDKRLFPFESDILKFDLSGLPTPMKVVANLPYHITTPILEMLFENRSRFTTLTLMVQTELAERMHASAGMKAFGSLSLFVQFHTERLSSFKVAPSCFYPKPNVDSTVLHLALRSPPIENSASFFALVRRAFQQRRKMLRVSLQEFYESVKIEKALIQADLKADARPEALSLEKWLAFYKFVGNNAPEIL